MAERTRRLVLALLIAPTLACAADAQLPWYQVEIVLFANDSAASQTAEVLTTDVRATQAAAAVALGPVWPAPLRPERTAELEMLWDSADAAPSLVRVTPGLDPETERLLRWLARLDARTSPPDLDWLHGLEFLTWDPEIPEAQPVPAISPELDYEARPAEVRAELDGNAEDDEEGDTPERPLEPSEIEVPMALAFRSVEPEHLVLGAEAASLRRARDFRVLAHLAWRQPFETGAPAIPVAVRWHDPVTDELRLAGSVGVALRRYLHVEFDLAWLEEISLDAFGEETLRWAHIEQSRRMRSGETHYVDHPRVGALVRITPFALAEPLTADAPLVPAPTD